MTSKEEAQKIGIAALQFFSLDASEQVKSWRSHGAAAQHDFFPDQREQDRGCDYFYGVACVFKTYGGVLYDKFLSVEDADHLEDFNHRLNVFMQEGTAAAWSEVGVHKEEVWENLRLDARKALDQVGEPLSPEPQNFDIVALISPDEFRTTEETRAILRGTRPGGD
jgi:hypothetical protein